MQKTRVVAWLEIAAAIAVLIGILLVVQELQQNNRYAQADSVRDLFQMWSNIYEFSADNQVSQLMSRSYNDPNAMTEDEIRLLDHYYWLVMNAELAQAVMARSGLTVGNQADFARLVAEEYFLSPFGRAWFELNGDQFRLYDPGFHQTISEHLLVTPNRTSDDYIEQLQKRF